MNQGVNEFVRWLEDVLNWGSATQQRLIVSALTIGLLVLARSIILGIIARRTEDPRTRYRWRKISAYLTSLLILFLVGRLWFKGIASLSTFLGLFSAGVAIALKDLLVNFAGWIFILWRKPFEVGDRVQIGDVAGDVIDLRIFQFTLLEIGNWVDAEQSTGRIIHIPNGWVFDRVQANYTKGFSYIWNEIPVLITFESNWEKAEQILNKILSEHVDQHTDSARKGVKAASRLYMIHYGTMTPKVYVSVRDSGILLTMRYLCQPRTRRGTEEIIWKEVLRAFAHRDDVDFAYPTIRTYNNSSEGKPQTGGGHPFPPVDETSGARR